MKIFSLGNQLSSGLGNSVFLRLVIYITIWCIYIAFMRKHAPHGIEWADYHSQRLFNAVEYLRLNGYWSNFSFSIWTSCIDCDLSSPNLSEKIYITASTLKLAPYFFLNSLGGEEVFRYFGSIIDKGVIFISGVMASEILVGAVRQRTCLPRIWISVVCFSLFVTSPWTYMMLIAAWAEIWFLLFFLLTIICFNLNSRRCGFIFFFLSCLVNIHWGFVLAFVWTSTFILGAVLKESEFTKFFIPKSCNNFYSIITIFGFSSLSLAIEFGLRLLFLSTHSVETVGSSLLFRIGISGTDSHNGGLLGALQFLGGSRLTVCFGDRSGFFSGGLEQKIAAYNCVLSIVSMAVISLFALVGLAYTIRFVRELRAPLFSLLVALLIFISVLQQSLSVHLLGYSYVFSFLFVGGILGLIIKFARSIKSSVLCIIFSTPLVIGVIFLSIRTSMLGGFVG